MRINHTIKILVASDFFFNAGFSIFAPVLAIFVTKQIDGGTIQVVGFGAAIVQLTKSVLQIPIARYLDKNHGEYDDFISLMIGTVLFIMVPFLYLLASTTTHVYLIQGLYGMGLAFVVPPWYAIFTRHIDKSQENTEWSLDSVTIGVAAAGSAALGGYLAEHIGFQSIFVLGGILAAIGGVVQIRIFSDLRKHVPRGTVKPEPGKIG